MTEAGKVVTATALSVLAHVALFTVLALMPERTRVLATPPPDDRPLEVTIHAEAPQDEAGQVPLNPVLPEPAQVHGIQTQLDPENLKKAAQAPEHPTDIAAHDSQATSSKSKDAAPAPTPEADPALALQPVAPIPEKAADEAGIDALGSYGKAVGNAIGVRWHFYQKSKKYYLAVGEVHLKIAIDAQGRVTEVRILSNSAQPSNAACAIRAVKEAQIPPISAERLAQVPGGRIEIEYTFISTP